MCLVYEGGVGQMCVKWEGEKGQIVDSVSLKKKTNAASKCRAFCSTGFGRTGQKDSMRSIAGAKAN